jgi:hypothetical protein
MDNSKEIKRLEKKIADIESQFDFGNLDPQAEERIKKLDNRKIDLIKEDWFEELNNADLMIRNFPYHIRFKITLRSNNERPSYNRLWLTGKMEYVLRKTPDIANKKISDAFKDVLRGRIFLSDPDNNYYRPENYLNPNRIIGNKIWDEDENHFYFNCDDGELSINDLIGLVKCYYLDKIEVIE